MARITALNAMEHMKQTTDLTGGVAKWLAKIFTGICLDALDMKFREQFRSALNDLAGSLDSLLSRNVGVLLHLSYDTRIVNNDNAEARTFVGLTIVGSGSDRWMVFNEATQTGFRTATGPGLDRPRGCQPSPFCTKNRLYVWVTRFGAELIDPETSKNAYIGNVR